MEEEIWCPESEVVLSCAVVGLVVARVPVGGAQGDRFTVSPNPTARQRTEKNAGVKEARVSIERQENNSTRESL